MKPVQPKPLGPPRGGGKRRGTAAGVPRKGRGLFQSRGEQEAIVPPPLSRDWQFGKCSVW